MTSNTKSFIEAIFWGVILFAVLGLIIFTFARTVSEDTRIRKTCYPSQWNDSFKVGDQLFAVCAAEDGQYKIKKVED